MGGLTKARKLRDLALDLGTSVVPDDAWGSEIVWSSLLHFAASTLPKHLICYTDLIDYVDLKTADGFLERDGPNIQASGRHRAGIGQASDAPGLGLTLRKETLGDPVHVISSGWQTELEPTMKTARPCPQRCTFSRVLISGQWPLLRPAPILVKSCAPVDLAWQIGKATRLSFGPSNLLLEAFCSCEGN